MKKNFMMRLASFLLVAVLISTSAISGTYAKYVTAETGADDARVAKFGVNITLNEEMFADSYKNTKTTWTAGEDVDNITVQSSAETKNVIAPGTEGTLADFSVTGTPEVDVQVTYTADLKLNGWFVDHDDNAETAKIGYCPVVITVNDKDYFIDGTTIKTTAELETAVEKAIVDEAAKYHTNEDLSQINDDLRVSWKWHFEGSTEHSGVGTGPANQWDALDTKLGDEAANDNAATIELEVGMAVTQID